MPKEMKTKEQDTQRYNKNRLLLSIGLLLLSVNGIVKIYEMISTGDFAVGAADAITAVIGILALVAGIVGLIQWFIGRRKTAGK